MILALNINDAAALNIIIILISKARLTNGRTNLVLCDKLSQDWSDAP